MILHSRNMQRKELLRILAGLAFFFGELGLSVSKEREVCESEECHLVSHTFLESMNLSVDPCVDFYAYTCGGWKANDEIIPPYELRWDRFMQLKYLVEYNLAEQLLSEISPEENLPTQQLKRWYQSCVDFETRNIEGLKPIKSLLYESGGWPMIMSTGEWTSRSKSWQAIELFYGKIIGEYAFFKAIAASCKRGPKLKLSPPDVPFEKELSRYEGSATDRPSMIRYRTLIRSIAQLFIEEDGTHVSPKQLDKDITDLIKFERKVHKAAERFDLSWHIQNYKEELEDAEGLDGFIEWWNDLPASIVSSPKSKMDWAAMFQAVFDIGGMQVDKSAEFDVHSVSYLIDLAKLLQSTDERTIVNYVHWHFVSRTVQYTNNEAKEILFEMIMKPLGFRERRPQWMECIKENPMPEAAAHFYATKYYTERTQETVDELVTNIREALAKQMRNSNWLSDDAKERVQNKLEKMGTVIGYPDWYKNETAFADFYKGLTIGDSYFENSLNFIRYKKEVDLRKFSGFVGIEDNWNIGAMTVNAVYGLWDNALMIPVADFQAPLFSKSIPSYVNYAIVGAMIGHEMGHGFDNAGIKSLPHSRDSLISGDMMDIYKERAKCFIEMFNNYFRGIDDDSAELLKDKTIISYGKDGRLIREKLTIGKVTLNENIADWTGFGASLYAYAKMSLEEIPDGEVKLPKFEEFSDERMFFISYAQIWCRVSRPEAPKPTKVDKHSPGILRVIGTLANTPLFAETFNCPKNSAMNPENKCNIWMESS